MLMILLSSLVTAAFAKTDSCSLTEILKSAKPDKKCVEAYLAKIPNEEDRSEAKFQLAQWKPIKDLQVLSGDGMIEAFSGEKLLMRTILLQKQKPMLIYLDGKILVDSSENPSFARRLDNALKKNKSAALDFFLPSAHANTAPRTQQALTVLYALDEPHVWGDAASVAERSNTLSRHVPDQGFFNTPVGRWITGGYKVIRCTSGDTVEATEFRQRSSYTDMDTTLKITPKSQTEFLVTGLQRGKTHLIRLKTWLSRIPGRTQEQPMLGLRSSTVGATISTCADPNCENITKTDPYEKWNYVLRKSPEQDEAFRKRNLSTNNETVDGMNRDYREELAGKLFGLSVMGSCCTSQSCRAIMEARFGIQIQPQSGPTGTSATTTD